MTLIRKLIIVVTLVVLAAGGWLAYYATSPLALPGAPVEFTVQPGSSLKQVARQLAENQALPGIAGAEQFVLLARLLGKAGEIKAGNYQLLAAATPMQLLERLTKGDVTQSEIKFIEGWTFREMRVALNSHAKLKHDTVNLSEQEILQRINASEAAAEGLFFPDTYFFVQESSDTAVLKRAYRAMQQHLETSWKAKGAGIPLDNPYQALILASIVEKETGRESDRAKVAAVFVNRLKIGMLLQTDPTVIYGLGEKFDGNLRKKDLLADQPYNTYTRAGLPPTPISMPGLASIQAVLNPAKTDALYFVARGDGSSEFSASLDAHNRAVNKFQRR